MSVQPAGSAFGPLATGVLDPNSPCQTAAAKPLSRPAAERAKHSALHPASLRN